MEQMALNYPGFSLPALRGFLRNTIWQQYGTKPSLVVEQAHDLMHDITTLHGLTGHYQAGFNKEAGTSYEHLRLTNVNRPDGAAHYLLYIQFYKNEFEHLHPLPYTAEELQVRFQKAPNRMANEALRLLILKFLEIVQPEYRADITEEVPGDWNFSVAVPGKKVSTIIQLSRRTSL